jgi:hypothetical protein
MNVNDRTGPLWENTGNIRQPAAAPENSSMPAAGIMLTRSQLETWAGFALSDHDVAGLTAAIPHSTIPDAVNTIVTVALGLCGPCDGQS